MEQPIAKFDRHDLIKTLQWNLNNYDKKQTYAEQVTKLHEFLKENATPRCKPWFDLKYFHVLMGMYTAERQVGQFFPHLERFIVDIYARENTYRTDKDQGDPGVFVRCLRSEDYWVVTDLFTPLERDQEDEVQAVKLIYFDGGNANKERWLY